MNQSLLKVGKKRAKITQNIYFEPFLAAYGLPTVYGLTKFGYGKFGYGKFGYGQVTYGYGRRSTASV